MRTGVVYIVAPAQTPSWIDRAHPRLRIIDQDALFPEEDCDTLPTFNTNAIEQWLWRVPGLADAAKVAGHGPLFVHMNDDYIFTAPIRPQVRRKLSYFLFVLEIFSWTGLNGSQSLEPTLSLVTVQKFLDPSVVCC